MPRLPPRSFNICNTEYNFVDDAGALVIQIEVVFPIDFDHDDLNDALNNLRNVGAAEIILRKHVAEDFGVACDILHNRAVKRDT